jgi:hypothetical protein
MRVNAVRQWNRKRWTGERDQSPVSSLSETKSGDHEGVVVEMGNAEPAASNSTVSAWIIEALGLRDARNCILLFTVKHLGSLSLVGRRCRNEICWRNVLQVVAACGYSTMDLIRWAIRVRGRGFLG